MKHHYERLGISEKKCYDKIVLAIENLQNKVVLMGNYSVEDMLRIVKAVSYDYPELFYVNFNLVKILQGLFQTELQINYVFSKFNISAVKKRTYENIQKVLNLMDVKGDDSDLVKCRKIHNFLIKNIVYQYEALCDPKSYFDAYTIAGVFNEKKAVCDGISKAFKFLCDYVGIENVVITGTSSLESVGDNVNHAWNIVKINGIYCHIDVTWDMCISQQCKCNRYDYFLIPDAWIEKDHKYQMLYNCSSITNSYFYNTKVYIESIDQLEKYLSDNILAKRKRKIYFKYKNKCDEDVVEKFKLLIEKYMARLNVTYSMYFVNNIEQNIFFVKINQL